MVAIVTALLGALCLTISSSIFSILFFANRHSIVYYCQNTNVTVCVNTTSLRILGATVPDPVFPTVTIVLMVLGAVATLLLGHLTFFHFYLSELKEKRVHDVWCVLVYKGISTYDYIVSRRDEERRDVTICQKLRKVRE